MNNSDNNTQNKKPLINKYIIKNNEMTVYYDDFDTVKFTVYGDVEETIRNRMLNDLRYKVEFYDKDKFREEISKYSKHAFGFLLMSFIFGYLRNNAESSSMRDLYIVTSYIVDFLVGVSIVNIKDTNKINNDFKKNKIYLEIKDILDENKDNKDIYKNVRNSKELDINSLYDYSYGQMSKIKSNLVSLGLYQEESKVRKRDK